VIILLFVLIFALIGAPVFAVMAGTAQLAWLSHDDSGLRFVRNLAPDVLDERFAGSPILVTVPLFTFIGYVMAESKAPERIVRASDAFLGWLPGGLAIVCIFASAFFTTLTGGSAVTIVAVGALLYPALVRYGYPRDYSLGLVMTGGSLGLLLPPSLPILIYSLVAGIDFTKAFKAGLIPGFLIMVLLSIQAMYIGVKHKIPRTKPNLKEMAGALWMIKWEFGLPVLILGSLGIGLAEVDEAAALAACYVLGVELFVHRDLTWKDLPRITKNSMALAGALVLIMAMANALANYMIIADIPNQVFKYVTEHLGITEKWRFLLALNLFMYVQGMLMEGISSILVAVPLLIPFASEFHLSPFHLAMMFLLNLEIAFMSPPFGQNLFVASFRFNRPMVSLYRLSLPFIGILFIALLIIMYVPKLSTVLVQGDIDAARAKAAQNNEPPRDAWMMECTQQDRNNPLPCTEADMKCWGKKGDGLGCDASGKPITAPPEDAPEPGTDDKPSTDKPDPGAAGAAGAGAGTDDDELDNLFDGKKPEKKDDKGAAGAAGAGGGEKKDKDEEKELDDMFK
jgi:C4-dicarboxylate transporter, DctM subunit